MTAKVAKSSGRGSKPGERRGGRQKGTRNKKTEELLGEVKAGGIMPLDYLLQVMRDEGAEEARRIDAAKAAAPYVHPKLQPVDKDGDTKQTYNLITGVPRASD